jgi:hypothetical protein
MKKSTYSRCSEIVSTVKKSEEHAIGDRELRTPCLTAQHRELVPQHDDLQLLERLGATTKQHELEQAAADQIGEGPEQEPAPRNQDGPTTLRPTRVSQAADRVNAPFRWEPACPRRRKMQPHRRPRVCSRVIG